MKNPIKPISNEIKPLPKNTADFVQVTRGYLRDLSELADKSLFAFKIFSFLMERMSRQNAVVVSQTTLAEILECDKSTISRAIKVLKNGNWVQVVKIGTSFGYLVNSRVVWRSHQEKRYGYFGADVIVSETEQAQTVEELENQPLKHIPNVKVGEMMISDNAELPPPDQKDLIEPDFDTVPHVKNDSEG